ncbi:MAG: OmpA family protein [Candidatus Rokubacteria bacterium]|nr:OmpA family protein [Candidatus Rokubacteria bacterium]
MGPGTIGSGPGGGMGGAAAGTGPAAFGTSPGGAGGAGGMGGVSGPEDNATWLKANPNALLLIEGHADERGTNEYNLALGERRAKATRDFLVSLGVEAGRMTVISYGEERPTCTERTEACWAQNRRAHFLVKQ